MWKKVAKNVFSTPVALQEDLFSDHHKQKEIEYRKRLIAKPGMYYDPTHRLEPDTHDHLAEAVADDEVRRNEAKSVQIDAYQKA